MATNAIVMQMCLDMIFNNNQQRKQSFWERVDNLNDINVNIPLSDAEVVKRYRLQRLMIQEIVNGLSQSQWSNHTQRSHAMTNAVLVNIIQN